MKYVLNTFIIKSTFLYLSQLPVWSSQSGKDEITIEDLINLSLT